MEGDPDYSIIWEYHFYAKHPDFVKEFHCDDDRVKAILETGGDVYLLSMMPDPGEALNRFLSQWRSLKNQGVHSAVRKIIQERM